MNPSVYISLDILNIHELNLDLIAVFMYSYFNNNLLEYLKNYSRLNENIQSHETWSASNIFFDYRKTNYGKFSSKYRGRKFWSNLPTNLKLSKAYSFKKNGKVYVQN